MTQHIVTVVDGRGHTQTIALDEGALVPGRYAPEAAIDHAINAFRRAQGGVLEQPLTVTYHKAP